MEMTAEDLIKAIAEAAEKGVTKALDAKLEKEAEDKKGELKAKNKSGIITNPEKSVEDQLKGVDREIAVVKALITRDHEAMISKALSEGTGSAGGYLVPEEFRNRVVEKQKALVSMRTLATVMPMTSDTMHLPTEGTDVTDYWVTENSDITASDPAFGEAVLLPTLHAVLVKASRQLLADANLSVVDYLAKIIANKLRRGEDGKFIVGTGTNQPKGIRQYSISAGTSQAGAALAYTDLVNLMLALPEGYRETANGFITSDSGLGAIMNIKDSQNRPIIVHDVQNQGKLTLFGKPVLVNNNIPANLGTGTDETEIWYGDLSYYHIGDREDLATEVSTEAEDAFKKHQVHIKTYHRVDGKLTMTEALTFIDGVK